MSAVTVLLIVRCDGRDGGCMASRTDVLADDKASARAHTAAKGWLVTDDPTGRREYCPKCRLDTAAMARTPDLAPVRTGRLAAVATRLSTPAAAAKVPSWVSEDPPARCRSCEDGDHRCTGRDCGCLTTMACAGHW